jgi:hypothetical protein
MDEEAGRLYVDVGRPGELEIGPRIPVRADVKVDRLET